MTRDPNATPGPTPIDLVPFMTAEVTVVNLADAPLAVSATIIDPETGDKYTVGVFEVTPLGVSTQSVIPAPYRLDFALAGGTPVGTCTIEIGETEQLQFAVVEDGVAITSSAGEPADAAELSVATSSRCGARAGP